MPEPAVRGGEAEGTVVAGAAGAAGEPAAPADSGSLVARSLLPERVPGRPRVVVLGSGWGSCAFIKALGADSPYDVVLVSPRNFFLYTPLLPGAAVGSVEERSIVEPVRAILAGKGEYLEAQCIDVNPEAKKIVCRASDVTSEAGRVVKSCPWHSFELDYDYLVVGIGAVPNTFGVPGVRRYCSFFKEIEDASRFRTDVTERFERALLPNTPDQRIRELLTFVVVGAGPTGVELAAELHDMVREDVAKLFPPRLLDFVSIKIVDQMDAILSTYDRRISDYATKHFAREGIDMLLNTAVKEVGDGVITLADRAGGEPYCMPFGVCVWAAGVKPNDLVQKIMDQLPEGTQTNMRALTTDKMLRVKGSGGSIYAIGDCSTIERPNSLACAERLYGDRSRTIGLKEFTRVLAEGAKEFPHLEELAKRAEGDDESIDMQRLQLGSEIDFEGFQRLLRREDDQLRALPATAQVAKQEAEYLAASFMAAAGDKEKLKQTPDKFQYAHKGSLAYVGADAAVLDIPGMGVVQGIAAGFIWKGFETFSQFSIRNQILVLSDLVRAKVFGRDTSAI